MVYRILLNDYRPLLKCGPAVVGALGVGASLGSSYITAKSSEGIADKNISAQQQENQINRDWQTQQAELARSYNTQERLASQDFAKQMIDYQNTYNAPAEQAKRLQAAGINPQIAMSGNVQNVSANSSPSSPQQSPMPAQVQGLSPVSQQPLDLQIPQLMNGIGSMFRNLAEAKERGVNTDILSKSAEYLIKNNMLSAQEKELANSILNLNKYILSETKDAAVLRAWDEAKDAMYKAVISSNEANRGDLINRVYESQDLLNKALSNYHGKNSELLGLEIGAFNRKLDAYIKLSGAQTSEAYAGARLKSAQSDFEEFSNSMRSHFKEDVFDTYITKLQNERLISNADAYEARRKIRVLGSIENGTDFLRKLDGALEWIKGKISIFGK